MELIIRNNSGQPIYDQISGQIKAQILSGALSPGDALPSIRGLAKDLKISVITTKRAYDELDGKGDYAYTMMDLESEATKEIVKALEAVDGVLRVRIIK